MENAYTIIFGFKIDADPQQYTASIMMGSRPRITQQFVNKLKQSCLNAINTYRLKAKMEFATNIAINTSTLTWIDDNSYSRTFTLYIDARQATDFLHVFWYIDHASNAFLCEAETINHRAIVRK